MGYVQLVIAVIGLAREIVKFSNNRDKCNKKISGEIKLFTQKIEKARKDGDNSDIEISFSNLFTGKRINTNGINNSE